MPKLSLRGYAAHRRSQGLAGGTLRAVQKAIASGRIKPDADGKIEPAPADESWGLSTDLARQLRPEQTGPQPPRGDDGDGAEVSARQDGTAMQNAGLTFQKARALREVSNARIAAIHLEKLQNTLVDADLVEQDRAREITMARTRFLGIPSKLRSAAPDTPVATLAKLQALIEETLKEMANARDGDDDKEI